MNERTKDLLKAIKDKKETEKANREKIKGEYKGKLTLTQRIERIERILGVEDAK